MAPVSLLTEAIEKTASQIVPILESLPLEAKRMNPKLTGHDIQLMKKAIARCRNAIADMEIETENLDCLEQLAFQNALFAAGFLEINLNFEKC